MAQIGFMVFESWDEDGYHREMTPIFDSIPIKQLPKPDPLKEVRALIDKHNKFIDYLEGSAQRKQVDGITRRPRKQTKKTNS